MFYNRTDGGLALGGVGRGGGFSVLGLVKGNFMGHSKECFSDPR